jgi:hypothetical protein
MLDRPASRRDRQRAYRCRERADGNGYTTLKLAAVGSLTESTIEVSGGTERGMLRLPPF